MNVSNQDVARRLAQVAGRLTGNTELQKDITQEMHLHLVKARHADPGRPLDWYVEGCEFHARNYLRRGRSIDSLKRAQGAVALGSDGGTEAGLGLMDPVAKDLRRELISQEIIELVARHLTARQQQSLELLLSGCGVRETARRLGVSHPAIIKHRRKIARLLAAFLDRKEGVNAPGIR